MKTKKKLYLQQKKRYFKTIFGTPQKPRLAVFRSNQHIYAQLIDDENGKSLVVSSSLQKDIKNCVKSTSNKQTAYLVGQKIAEKALQKNISKVIFDRAEKPYIGRIQSLAEGARNIGLLF